MAARETSRGRLTFTSMFSLDPATVGKAGYREIFQAGEALNGRPLIDRQHPHDLFMQLAAIWRVPMSASTGFTLAGRWISIVSKLVFASILARSGDVACSRMEPF